MASRSPSRSRRRASSRTPPRSNSNGSRSPPPTHRRHRHDSRSPSRSRSRSRSITPPRRNGRNRSGSRDRSRERGRDSRSPSEGPPKRATKIVVERLSKNVNEEHLYEIFGQFGHIKDLDLPMNRTSGTNRSTAYILYEHQADAEVAISYMHEAQIDGAIINVSIVLPRRKSPGPPLARRGANIDPRVPFQSSRGGGPPSGPLGGGGGGGRRRFSPSSRYGPRSDVYRPNSLSPARSPGGVPSSRGGGGGGSRYRSRSNGSYSSRSRSRSPAPRRRGGGGGNGAGRYDDRDTRRRSRSRSFDSDRSASRNRGRNYR
ncbi:hypothetical protein TsFJ059_008708 [Trichoderma semiorbis]|uniref:RRM domain-containing protein n=1 Tax=Trichoderma semiorbis TaxID=1491008 RepID=A0A9P8KL45_9HYPO|nr:hypothetical protein TsFJ059_008708 [Trichoderma semiorbis]